VSATPFYGKPFGWLLFAIGVSYVPIVGYMVEAGMAWNDVHPAINAMLNATSFVFLVVGWFAIRRRNISLHKSCMIAAFSASGIFLASYLLRYYLSGSHRYPGDGWDKGRYLIILMSHMVLAMVVLPMILRTIYLGLKDRRAKHKKIARWTWPVWIYVSLTGVIVYLMLYPIANAVYR
jgi:putative membrane protein